MNRFYYFIGMVLATVFFLVTACGGVGGSSDVDTTVKPPIPKGSPRLSNSVEPITKLILATEERSIVEVALETREKEITGQAPNLAASSYLMGQSFSNWGVGNTQIGNSWDIRPAYPFFADTSSEITSFKVYWIWDWFGPGGSGYSAGDGGTIRIDVVEDNGGLPGSTVIATTTLVAGIKSANQTSNLAAPGRKGGPATHLITPLSPAVAGQKYWLTFKNIASDPTNNFLSINGLAGKVGAETPLGWEGSQGAPNELEGRTMNLWTSASSTVNVEDRGNMGIYQINYADNTTEGFGIVGGRDEMQNLNKITQTNWIRQKITPLRNNTILDAHLNCARLSGNGHLVMTVADEKGTVLATDSVPVSSLRTQSHNQDGTGGTNGYPYNHRWESFDNIKGFTMDAGETYYVTLNTDNPNTEVNVYGGQLGNYSGYGFAPNSLGHQGNSAEVSNNSGLTWGHWNFTESTTTPDVELPIFFNKYSPK